MKQTVGAIILNENGEVLLQKKNSTYRKFPQKWCFFGGSVEEGETLEEAMNREIVEEIGINLEFTFFKKFNMTLERELNVFLAKFNKRLTEIRLDEGAGFAFFEKNEIPSLNMIESNKKALLEYIKKEK